ncbi:MAG: hypothetical protein R2854_27950 [Caldilineaceae bacterium]
MGGTGSSVTLPVRVCGRRPRPDRGQHQRMVERDPSDPADRAYALVAVHPDHQAAA